MQYFTIQEGQKNYYPVHSAEQIGGKTIEDILNKFSPWKHTVGKEIIVKVMRNFINIIKLCHKLCYIFQKYSPFLVPLTTKMRY